METLADIPTGGRIDFLPPFIRFLQGIKPGSGSGSDPRPAPKEVVKMVKTWNDYERRFLEKVGEELTRWNNANIKVELGIDKDGLYYIRIRKLWKRDIFYFATLYFADLYEHGLEILEQIAKKRGWEVVEDIAKDLKFYLYPLYFLGKNGGIGEKGEYYTEIVKGIAEGQKDFGSICVL